MFLSGVKPRTLAASLGIFHRLQQCNYSILLLCRQRDLSGKFANYAIPQRESRVPL